ncbi:helix-turn-helix domain-containing protein [Rubrobacter calidifluminis]|uniref:helix-turn-helix domain-containing protein n=1 Tax=Rubrobacter calidifluminis TaxID=1392640 RepID=UPI00236181CD|nr:helix-turn-helix domain-containing protein [Rubrobacter calidifluminis]
MSVWAEKWAYECQPRTSGAKFVLVCLAHHADEEGYCYPSQRRLAAMTGLKERAVRTHLAALEEDGFIRRKARRRDGRRTSDLIQLLIPEDELRLPAEIAASRKATGKKRHDLPAKNDANNRQNLPGKDQKKGQIEQSEYALEEDFANATSSSSGADGKPPHRADTYVRMIEDQSRLLGVPLDDDEKLRIGSYAKNLIEKNKAGPPQMLRWAARLATRRAENPRIRPSQAWADVASCSGGRRTRAGSESIAVVGVCEEDYDDWTGW